MAMSEFLLFINYPSAEKNMLSAPHDLWRSNEIVQKQQRDIFKMAAPKDKLLIRTIAKPQLDATAKLPWLSIKMLAN